MRNKKKLFLVACTFLFFGVVNIVAAEIPQDNMVYGPDGVRITPQADPNAIPTGNGVLPNDTRLHNDPNSAAAPTLPAPAPSVKNFEYPLLEAFPGFFIQGDTTTDLPTMVLAIYKFGIWTVGIAGLFMLVVGGFMYMASAGNTSTAGSARGIIADALLGIVAALGAYLILYVINPDLTRLNMSFTPVRLIPVSADMKNLATQVLASSNIAKNSSGDCKDAAGNTVSPLFNLYELRDGKPMTFCNPNCKTTGNPCIGQIVPPLKMLNIMLEISAEKPFTITSIGGGQHAANSAHYKGTALDIDASSKSDYASLVDAFEKRGANKDQTSCDLNGKFLTDCSTANHVHIDFQ